MREITIRDFGIDQRNDFAGVQRRIIFAVDGPSIVTARLSGVNSGKVRMCLRGPGITPNCIEKHEGTIVQPVYELGQGDWNVSLIGISGVPGQYATVTIDFNSVSPDIALDSFRFNGTSDPTNNGFELVFGPNETSGDFHFKAFFDDGNSYMWHLHVGPDDAAGFDQDGTSSAVNVTTPIDAGTVYTVRFQSPEFTPTGATGPVILDGVELTWP
jgi:hypothetical protein